MRNPINYPTHFVVLQASQETANRESIISFLVNSGANVNSQDTYGLTPLHFAAIRSDDVAALELMRRNNIDINVSQSYIIYHRRRKRGSGGGDRPAL